MVTYVCMYKFATKKIYIQWLRKMVNNKCKKINKIFTIHFSSKFDIYKLKTPLIIVAGISLKDRVDLISIMVPLEVIEKIF